MKVYIINGSAYIISDKQKMNGSNPKNLRSSTDEHETLSRDQIILNNDLPSGPSLKQSKHRSELDPSERRSNVDPLPFTSLSDRKENQHLLSRLSSRINQLQDELVSQKKKNSKFRKIITSKVQKEKELESAYKDIAIELKKEMSGNPACFCKNKGFSDQLDKENSAEMAVDPLAGELCRLRDQNQKLKQEIDMMKVQYQTLKLQNENLKKQDSSEDERTIELDHLKVTNIFYKNQLQKITLQNMALTSELKKLSTIREEQPEKIAIVHQQPVKMIKKLEASEDIEEQMKKIQIMESRFNEKNNLEGWKNEEKLINRSIEGEDEQKINSEDKEEMRTVQKPLEFQKEKRDSFNPLSELSFKTVTEHQQFSSFYSIRNSSTHKPMEKMASKQYKIPDFQDVSSVCLQRMLQTSVLHESADDLNYFSQNQHQPQQPLNPSPVLPSSHLLQQKSSQLELLQQPECERQRLTEQPSKSEISQNYEYFSKCIHTLYCFIKAINKKVNLFCLKFNISVDFPQIYQMTEKIQSRKMITSHSNLNIWVSSSRIQEIADDFIGKLYLIQKMTKKEQQKEQNNLNLQLFEANLKMSELRDERLKIQKKLQTLMQYNKKLQYQISELSYSSQPNSPNQKNALLHQIYRSKITMSDPQIDHAEVQCVIIQHSEYEAYQKFINSVVDIANLTLRQKIGVAITGEMYIFGDLQEQFKKIVQKIINVTMKHAHETFHNRKKSMGCLSSKSEQMIYDNTSTLLPKKSLSPQQHQQMHSQDFKQPLGKDMPPDLLQQQQEIDYQLFYQAEAQNEQLVRLVKQKDENILMLKQKVALQRYELQRLRTLESELKTKQKVSTAHLQLQQHRRAEHREKTSMAASSSSKKDIFSDEEPQFLECSQVREYNNLNAEKDEEIKLLKETVELLRRQLMHNPSKTGEKKNKIIYLNY